MKSSASAFIDGAMNYRIIAHRALRGGDKGKFYSAMQLARRCIYYARSDL